MQQVMRLWELASHFNCSRMLRHTCVLFCLLEAWRCCAHHKALEGWLMQDDVFPHWPAVATCIVSTHACKTQTSRCVYICRPWSTILQCVGSTCRIKASQQQTHMKSIMCFLLHVSMIAYRSAFNVGRPLVEVVNPSEYRSHRNSTRSGRTFN